MVLGSFQDKVKTFQCPHKMLHDLALQGPPKLPDPTLAITPLSQTTAVRQHGAEGASTSESDASAHVSGPPPRTCEIGALPLQRLKEMLIVPANRVATRIKLDNPRKALRHRPHCLMLSKCSIYFHYCHYD